MGSARDAVAILDSWTGKPEHTENPKHSNCCKVTQDYGPIGGVRCYAWCCATFWDVMRLIGIEIPKSAQVLDMSNRAKRGEKGLRWIPRTGHIEVGDWVCFDWKGNGNAGDMHISMVRNPDVQSRFETVGGNENDTVFRQHRDRDFVFGFIRPPYDNAPPAQEDDMTPEQAERLKGIETLLNETLRFRQPDGSLGNAVSVAHFQEIFNTWEPIILGLDDGSVDVDKLASVLADRLGDDVAKALGERLANG